MDIHDPDGPQYKRCAFHDGFIVFELEIERTTVLAANGYTLLQFSKTKLAEITSLQGKASLPKRASIPSLTFLSSGSATTTLPSILPRTNCSILQKGVCKLSSNTQVFFSLEPVTLQ